MAPHRMAYLLRDRDWIEMYFGVHSSDARGIMERLTSRYSGSLLHLQVFDEANKLLIDRHFHPILDEVTRG